MLPRSPLALALLLGTSLLPPFAAAAPVWREQGPGPIYGGSNVATQPRNPEAGAIAAIALSPTDSSLIYVGAVNGGIWRSTDATASVPHWTPLTDRSLPALSIASLAISPANDRIIFAGTGSQSSLTNVGSNGFGIARSLDGGDTWSVIGGTTFAGQHVSAVVPTKLEGGSLLLAGSRRPAASDVKDPDAGAPPAADAATAAAGTVLKYGLYRTENAVSPDPDKVVFKMISGTGAGLPPGGVSAIAADPVHPGHFYTSISARDGGQAAAGVYYSHDGGATWARINGSGARQLTGLGNSSRILLSAYADAKTVAVYAAVIAADGTLSGVFRTVSQGKGWVSMGVPTPSIFPGNQGDLHGALVADPKDPNVVFIAGDTHDLPDPSGCKSYYGAIVRGDASKAGSQRWHSVVCDNAQGTAPHADSRAMAFTADGNLIEADDGGIYQLTAPNGASPKWSSLIGNIRPTEFHSIAYDPLSKVIFGGAQDNGVPMQGRQNGLAWEEFAGGDGGVVAVDADQTVHPGKTLRYTAYTNLQFLQRSTWDQSNNLLGTKEVALRIVAGTACQKTLAQCDGTAPFYTPMVLNKIDPRRMLIGTNSLYESPNGGDSLIYLGKLGDTVGGASPFGRPMVYGGKLNGKDYPGMFYVGSGARLFHRVVANGRITTLAAYKGDEIRTVAVNPFNYRQVFVLDAAGQLWGSLDEGAHFSSMTGNLRQLTPKMGTLTVYAPDGVASHAVIIAGGFGIFQAHVPAAGAEPTWTKLATGFPNVLVGDLQYDNASDTLVAGTLGRGAWSLSGFFTGTTAVANAEPTSEAMPKPFGNQKRALPSLELKSRTP